MTEDEFKVALVIDDYKLKDKNKWWKKALKDLTEWHKNQRQDLEMRQSILLLSVLKTHGRRLFSNKAFVALLISCFVFGVVLLVWSLRLGVAG